MTPRALLDTDILSEILKGRNALVMRRAADYAAVHGRFTFTAVSVLEALYGLHHKDARRQLLDAEAAFARNEVILPTLEDYENAGRIRGVAKRQGRQLTTDDCLIGAVAHRLGVPLVTGNTAHYEAMIDAGFTLDLHNWRQEPHPMGAG